MAIATPSAQSVVSATQDIPVVFSAVTDSVERGAVAALGFNYRDIGRQTGDRGEDPHG